MNGSRWVWPSVVIAAMLSSCRGPMVSEGKWRSGTHKCKTDVTFNLMARSYLLHVPDKVPEGRWPLVLVLHGAFDTARKVEHKSGFSDLADREGFCVVYPNGIGIFGLLQRWNAGHCCGKAAKDSVDDVGYLDAVIRDVLSVCPVDENRIYLVGHSNGGMMVYRYAAERSERVAGAAVVAGAIFSRTEGQGEPRRLSHPKCPVPMLIVHGTDDRAIPPGGGVSPAKSGGHVYAPLSEAEDFWTKANGAAAPVQVVLLEGWGHEWPGPHFTHRSGVPEALRGYDAAAVIWEFFQRAR